jgi:hypothetical protein
MLAFGRADDDQVVGVEDAQILQEKRQAPGTWDNALRNRRSQGDFVKFNGTLRPCSELRATRPMDQVSALLPAL